MLIQKMLSFFLVVLLVLVLLLISVTALSSGLESSSPKKVMEAYITALKSGNYKKAWSFICEESRKEIAGPVENNGFEQFKEKNDDLSKDETMKEELMSSKVTGEKVEEDRATVGLDFTGEAGAATQDIRLVKEKGKWRIKF